MLNAPIDLQGKHLVRASSIAASHEDFSTYFRAFEMELYAHMILPVFEQ